jgi:uncharacterized protein YndB with AHSA1/START domain
VRSLQFVLALGSVLGCAGAAQAEVREARDGMFLIERSIATTAAPAAAYVALVRVSGWWDPAHSWSGAAKNLRLEPKAGGCFCEKLPDGGSVEHARVVFAQPGKMIRLEGALGPLQDMAVTGVLTFKLEPDSAGTKITMSYRVSGALAMDATKLVPLVDQVLGGQLERLRSFATTGSPIK